MSKTKNQNHDIYSSEDFGGKGTHTGGKTGSVAVEKDGKKFQRKIGKNSLAEDMENISELIAANIAQEILPENGEYYSLVPQVNLFIDPEKHKFGVVSKYLESKDKKIETLAEFADGVVRKKHKNTSHTISEGDHEFDYSNINEQEQNHINIDGVNLSDSDTINNKRIKQDVANLMATSMMVGDIDFNPGNIITLKDEKNTTRLARIDFGKSFNAFLNISKPMNNFINKMLNKIVKIFFNVHRENKKNNIVDSINRTRIMSLNAEHKLWRSHKGIILSEEMSNALKNSASQVGKIDAALDKVKNNMLSIKDPKIKERILISLENVNKKNKFAETIKPKSKTIDDRYDAAFATINNFCRKNAKDMENTAKLIDLQMTIDKALNKGGKNLVDKDLNNIINQYAELKKADNMVSANGKIEWLKDKKDSPVRKMNLDQYIEDRAKELGKQNFISTALSTREVLKNYNITKEQNPQRTTRNSTFVEKEINRRKSTNRISQSEII